MRRGEGSSSSCRNVKSSVVGEKNQRTQRNAAFWDSVIDERKDPREGSAGGGVAPSSRTAAAAAFCCSRRRRRPGSCRFCLPSPLRSRAWNRRAFIPAARLSCHSHRRRHEVRRRCCSCQRRHPWVRQRREIREEGRIRTCPATAHSCRSYHRPSSSNPPPPKLLAATSGRTSTSAAGERCCHRKPSVYVGNCRRNPCLLGLGSNICVSKLRLLLNHRSFGECRSFRLVGLEGHCCFVSRGCCRCCKIEDK
ncbi:uncharacterized protein [Arachis hypogaea]|uniref:uncharacterized protein n=1 Tax=Arachis hypogaea TaxID=3818 RepID=UPI000DECD225